MRKIIAFLILPALLIGCSALTGEEIGRLKINEISTEDKSVVKETTIALEKGDYIAIWSDMDLEYKGSLDLRFIIEIFKDDELIEELEIDPFDKNVTMNERKISLNKKTEWRFLGKNKKLSIKDDGEYKFRAYLVTLGNPDVEIKKAEIVLKK